MWLSSRSAWVSRFFASGVGGGVPGGVPFSCLLTAAAAAAGLKGSSASSETMSTSAMLMVSIWTTWGFWSTLLQHVLPIVALRRADSGEVSNCSGAGRPRQGLL
eukprot:CAMPEP_0197906678 /NCGR_PEP_ID=MMETSP1439-20131203/63224_1 /TAXON_ID=66791 /ORGANISM="Gonyaulax spinifera, Strain CCMP409" /LENGTH=103 /DNA_ID=CAMNT_0043528055 /DNA_START=121 /DNA_END=429 /DNA_ORIENTATION=+